jgi:tRNA dimethylallyltransferase
MLLNKIRINQLAPLLQSNFTEFKSMQKENNKVIVILGPTSGGKTKLAVSLAQKFNGEIVSADSRQVYKGMDIGTGKDLAEYKIGNKKIKYHLIDVVSPKTEFNLAKYQKLAYQAIDDILSRGKLPIIAGGSGLYIQSIVDGYQLSAVKPDKKLRAKLEKMTAEKLFAMLKKIDLRKANSLNESERKNKRRLVRHIEVAKSSKKTEKIMETSKYKPLLLGLTFPKEVLEKRIYQRLIKRLEKENMVGEVKRLRKRGVSWKRLEGFGLEYKYVSLYLRGKLTYDEMVNLLNIAIRQFAKRQMTWFKRDKRIKWIKNKQEARRLMKKFLE